MLDADDGDSDDDDDDGKNKKKRKRVVKGLSTEELEHYKKAHERSGLLYMSRVPPFMKPEKVRHLLSKYGEIGRIYLAPEDENARKRRRKMGGNRKLMFTEGWVEFKDKKVAKLIAKTLNAQPIGGSKRNFHQHDLWTLKYLPKFKWNHLTERIAYERAARQQRMQTEMEQARREDKAYLQNVERAKVIEAIQERKRQKQQVDTNMSKARRTFQQKEVTASEVRDESRRKRAAGKGKPVQTSVDPQVKSVLAKLF
ncbi:hypothetical protein THASP1DRAFT_15081 [Thamnocephalis sphaerospora]|uniref:18S rRNA factor 2 n=1 Tax=Thamnocephalis sphaerospora TaxID=78915 RepID=A0A4P9XRW3_9FUNG|nr:hypothetical protein THASP1DRAFT_15081 [Thamnocephalis sphaerospora]|eukprot:RKP08844.1 hypothetical protein THASP1DRAFT_15081 [Thamnocephalis sphaerospora]